MVQFVDSVPSVIAEQYLTRLRAALDLVPLAAVDEAVCMILDARQSDHRVYVMGNGGSAATASHFVCDLVKTAAVAGQAPVRALALTDNIALLTAWANDHSYDRVFAEQIRALVEPGDVVIGFSASGNSPNVIAGFEAALAHGAQTIGLFGFQGGIARDLVDVAIHVPCDDYGLTEDTHSAIGHAITAAVRAAIVAGNVE